MNDPRGPMRTILAVDSQSSVALVKLDCGHIAECNPIFHYVVGESLHCFNCGKEEREKTA
jgi:hypothetical protein